MLGVEVNKGLIKVKHKGVCKPRTHWGKQIQKVNSLPLSEGLAKRKYVVVRVLWFVETHNFSFCLVLVSPCEKLSYLWFLFDQ